MNCGGSRIRPMSHDVAFPKRLVFRVSTTTVDDGKILSYDIHGLSTHVVWRFEVHNVQLRSQSRAARALKADETQFRSAAGSTALGPGYECSAELLHIVLGIKSVALWCPETRLLACNGRAQAQSLFSAAVRELSTSPPSPRGFRDIRIAKRDLEGNKVFDIENQVIRARGFDGVP